MDHQNKAAPFLRLLSTDAEPSVKVDIIHGLSGYEFSRMRLTAGIGSAALWTNRTRISQTIQIEEQVIRLAPGGKHGAAAVTHFDNSGQFAGRLLSNPAASITVTITAASKL